MRFSGRRPVAIAAMLVIALSSAAAEGKRRTKKKQEQETAAPVATPADKRDRAIAAPGTPFNGRAYWQAAAQCGGIYFKLGTVYSEAAIKAKVVKPDPAAYTSLSKDADNANKTATAFFVAAERFLVADRKLTRDEAVIVYDPVSSASGDRVKSVEAGLLAAKACPDLYKTCRGAFPQVCSDAIAPTS